MADRSFLETEGALDPPREALSRHLEARPTRQPEAVPVCSVPTGLGLEHWQGSEQERRKGVTDHGDNCVSYRS